MKTYLVCPRCGEITEKAESWDVELRMRFLPKILEGEVVLKMDPLIPEQVVVSHNCGFKTDQYPIDAFSIKVEDDEVVEYGWYWDDFTPQLREIVALKGWEVRE